MGGWTVPLWTNGLKGVYVPEVDILNCDTSPPRNEKLKMSGLVPIGRERPLDYSDRKNKRSFT